METIKITAEQLLNNSQQSLSEDLDKKEISLYGEGEVSSKVLANCFIDLQQAFPKLPVGWYNILEKLLDTEKFTDKRLMDATNNLIKTCIYPEPTIANILGYDKKMRLYTYEEAINKNGGNFNGWDKKEDGLWYKK